MDRQPVIIYDTTLRDGTQGSGVSFTVEDKLKIARRLDELRFDYVEGGWPGSNPRDAEFFSRAKDTKFNYAKIAAFGSTRKANIQPQSDRNLQYLIEADTPAITIFGKSSLFQVRDALRTSPKENLDMISDSVAYLKSRGKEVIYDAEHFFDGFKEDKDYSLKTLQAAKSAGADFLVLCDTNGGTPFHRVPDIIKEVKKALTGSRLGIHAHNDAGYGVANSEAALIEGVEMVQGTINGIGERVGNANLITILGNIFQEGIPATGNIDVSQLRPLSRLVYELANLPPDLRQPYVGDFAFAHKGGVHVDAVNRNPALYEHADPAAFGNARRFLVSDLAGAANFEALSRYDLSKSDPITRKILEEVKEREHMGYSYEVADGSLELLIKKIKGEQIHFFDVLSYITLDKQNLKSTSNPVLANVHVSVRGHTIYRKGSGDGPVNALDVALRAVLESEYPELKQLELADYRVREIPERRGTASRVRVLIESRVNGFTFGTVGVGENSTQAALEALVDSFNYAHLKIQEK
ncbi:citramalate synthase [Candidatus Woesearchaeota archaeon]|nr:citramalate synthase [Candidatus Woesearchaeota archaeon]